MVFGIAVGFVICALIGVTVMRLWPSVLRDDPGRIRMTRKLMTLVALILCLGGGLVLAADAHSVVDDQIGAVLLQTGIATLVIGFISFELLVEERVPQAVFGHGYFGIANKSERIKLLKSSIGALADLDLSTMDDAETIFPAYFPAVRDFIEQTFKAPVRYDYRAIVTLKDTKFIESGDASKTHESLLTVEIDYSYHTECNRLPQAVRVNGDGVIHRVDVRIPDDLEIYATLCEGSQFPRAKIRDWIFANMCPEVRVAIDDGDPTNVPVTISEEDIVTAGNGNEVRRLQFSVRIDTLIDPESRMRVQYVQRSAAKPNDGHHWVAFTVTRGFKMVHKGFEERCFGIIPIAESTPWSKHLEGAPGQQMATVHQSAEMDLDGIVFPGATFGYSWYLAGKNA